MARLQGDWKESSKRYVGQQGQIGDPKVLLPRTQWNPSHSSLKISPLGTQVRYFTAIWTTRSPGDATPIARKFSVLLQFSPY